MTPTVAIDCCHDHVPPARSGEATVAVDVIRATTTAVTAAATGRRVFLAASIEAAVPLAAALDDPVLTGELGGFMPYGFHLQNSPAAVAEHEAPERPMILLSTSGTRLMVDAAANGKTYAACLRNVSAQVEDIVESQDSVRLLGADSRGEFRPEDQLCCARIARGLVAAGYRLADPVTEAVFRQWSEAPDDAFLESRSVAYLRETRQEHDLDYVLEHIDDLRAVFPIAGSEVLMRRLA